MADDLTIGVEDIKYYPYFEMREKEYKGFARELFDSFAKKYNHKITFIPLPVARLSHTFLRGEIDFRFPDSPNWTHGMKRGFNVKYSSPVVTYTDGIFVLKENLGKKDLKQIGTISGFSPQLLQERISSKEVVLNENQSLNGLLEQVRRGRIEGAYFNIAVAQATIQKRQYHKFIFFDENQIHITDSYFLSTIHKPKILVEFNQFLKLHEKEVSKLKSKYGLDK